MTALVGLDGSWYLDVNAWSRDSAWAHGFMAAYALWGGLVALAVLLVAGWWWARHRADPPRAVATAVLTGVAAVVALGVNQLLGPAIGRPRPFLRYPDALVLLPRSSDYSLPSDHCMIAGAFVVGLFVLNRWLGGVAAALAVLLAFSRVYVGVHYPGDTVAGLVIGAVIGALLLLALGPATALVARLAVSPLRPLVVARPHASSR